MGLNDMYILVTPAKNEEENLPRVIKCVLAQTKKPRLWLIVDDGSTDNTYRIAKKHSELKEWIYVEKLNREKEEYDTEFGYSKVVKFGIENAMEKCQNEKINYKYVGILDADILLEKNYFELLLDKAESTKNCGIISGRLDLDGKKDFREGYPRGGAMLFHKKCLKEIGGYPITAAPDTVTNIKAKNRGWNLIKYYKAKGLQLRPPREGAGIWKGYKRKAEGRYYLNYHPVNAFLTSLYLCTKFPFYQGIAYFVGYFKSYFLNEPQTDDEEVKRFFYYESFNNLRKKIKKRLLFPFG